MNKKYVLDASALLALLNEEPGSDHVEKAIEQGSVLGAVNLSEVVSKLSEFDMPADVIHELVDSLGITIVEFDKSLAYNAGLLRKETIQSGLSLGDRACLAVAEHLKLPCLTADKAWATLKLSVEIKLIR